MFNGPDNGQCQFLNMPSWAKFENWILPVEKIMPLVQ